MKTSELTGAALDWAVAKCEGVVYDNPAWTSYSTDWAQGGPIIERMKPLTGVIDPNTEDEEWYCTIPPDTNEQTGPTLLIAAMRCYVASKLGDEVGVPDELA